MNWGRMAALGKSAAKTTMKSSFEYRSYQISNRDGRYIAESMDDEPCFLCSNYLLRVLRAIDAMWLALEDNSMPSWLMSWVADPAIDLDREAGQILPIDHNRPVELLRFPARPVSAAAA